MLLYCLLRVVVADPRDSRLYSVVIYSNNYSTILSDYVDATTGGEYGILQWRAPRHSLTLLILQRTNGTHGAATLNNGNYSVRILQTMVPRRRSE